MVILNGLFTLPLFARSLQLAVYHQFDLPTHYRHEYINHIMVQEVCGFDLNN